MNIFYHLCKFVISFITIGVCRNCRSILHDLHQQNIGTEKALLKKRESVEVMVSEFEQISLVS